MYNETTNNACNENTNARRASRRFAPVTADSIAAEANRLREDALESLREDRFMAKIEAELDPLGRYIANKIEDKHGHICEASFHFGDAPHFDKQESAAWGFLEFETACGKSCSILACAIESDTMLCAFEGEEVLLDYLDVEEHLVEVADTLVRETERGLGLVQY